MKLSTTYQEKFSSGLHDIHTSWHTGVLALLIGKTKGYTWIVEDGVQRSHNDTKQKCLTSFKKQIEKYKKECFSTKAEKTQI